MTEGNTKTNIPSYRVSSAPSYQDAISGDLKQVRADLIKPSTRDIDCDSVPRSQYTSPKFAAREQEKMWPFVWQIACRVDEIPEAGDCHVYESPGASILVVRGDDLSIKAYYNSCPHRGMKLCTQHTSVPSITCPFHGFSWNLDGSSKFVPSRWDFPQLDKKELSLPEIKIDFWEGFVFVNRDENAKPLHDYLETLIEDFEDWNFDKMYLATRIRKTMNANWKACVETFIEAFHVPHIHAQAMPFGGDSSCQYDVGEKNDHISRMLQPLGFASDQHPVQMSQQDVVDETFKVVLAGMDAPEISNGMTGRDCIATSFRELMAAQGVDVSTMSDTEILDAMQYSIFPNIVLFRSLGYPYMYRFLPVDGDHEKTVFDFMMFAPLPEGDELPPETNTIELGPDDLYSECGAFPPWLGQIYDQDTEGMAQLQDGIRSGQAEILFSRYQEVRLRHLHATLDKYLNA